MPSRLIAPNEKAVLRDAAQREITGCKEPLSPPEDINAQKICHIIANCGHFTDGASQNMVSALTGLLRHTWLPFGVVSSPTITFTLSHPYIVHILHFSGISSCYGNTYIQIYTYTVVIESSKP